MKTKRILGGLLLIGIILAWMAMIYRFSAQTATQSADLSRSIALYILHRLGIQLSGETFTRYHAFIRKCAHFSIYLGLGIWSYLFMRVCSVYFPRLTAACLCVGFAAADEYHQLSVLGRGGQWSDVGIDSMGALMGILLAALLWNILQRIFHAMARKR
ncbi:MAG: VanZ family protein [Clostridia bacterium]